MGRSSKLHHKKKTTPETKTSKDLQWGRVKGVEWRVIPILEPWDLFPGGDLYDLRHFVVEGIKAPHVGATVGR